MRARSGVRMKYWYSNSTDSDVEIKIVQFVYVNVVHRKLNLRINTYNDNDNRNICTNYSSTHHKCISRTCT